MATIFQKGDKVSWAGLEGIIITYSEGIDLDYPLGVLFKNGLQASFTVDGKYMLAHIEPSLKFIERPRKTKKIKVWANVYINSKLEPIIAIHKDKSDSTFSCERGGVTQEIEIEVLDV